MELKENLDRNNSKVKADAYRTVSVCLAHTVEKLFDFKVPYNSLEPPNMFY